MDGVARSNVENSVSGVLVDDIDKIELYGLHNMLLKLGVITFEEWHGLLHGVMIHG